MSINFKIVEILTGLIQEIEFSAPESQQREQLPKHQKEIYRTAKGLLEAIKKENIRTPQLFQIDEEAHIRELRKVKTAFEKLAKIRDQLHRLDETSCNFGLTERQEKREAKLEKEAHEIAESLKLQSYHQGDPRGWSLYLLDRNDKEPELSYYHGLAV